MKILLDENIMPKAKLVLEQYDHDVIHVLERFSPGQTDKQVFELSISEQRALITLNGKDFIVFIPPQQSSVEHYGLIWLRGFQVTTKTYKKIMEYIGQFLKLNPNSIRNSYYVVKPKENSYIFIQRYPRTFSNITCLPS